MDGPVAAPVRRAQRPRQRAEVRDEVGDREPARHRDWTWNFFGSQEEQAEKSDAVRVVETGTVEAGAAYADGKVNATGGSRRRSTCRQRRAAKADGGEPARIHHRDRREARSGSLDRQEKPTRAADEAEGDGDGAGAERRAGSRR